MKKLITVFLLVGAIFVSYSYSSISSTEIKAGKYAIEKGDSFASIPKRFNLDINSTLYKVWLRLNSPTYDLQAGTYSIDNNTTLGELFSSNLKKPNSLDFEITILPGRNIFDIDNCLSNPKEMIWIDKSTGKKRGCLYKFNSDGSKILVEDKVINEGDFISKCNNDLLVKKHKYEFLGSSNSLEGFLYPDTYRVSLNSISEAIINISLLEFESRIYKKFKQRDNNKFYNKLILASIVEREEKVSENKPIVAGILQKRLDEGIAIGADATVCYSYSLTQSGCNQDFINEHIYIKSSYNTRSQLGLPPTPISSVSLDTINATFNQESSPYYYYLHDNSGFIHYGKTLSEHNRNKNLYLK